MLKSALALAAASLFLAGTAAAGPTVVKPVEKAALQVATTFDCAVTPVAPPKSADLFQTTSFTLTKKTGNLPAGRKVIEVRLGTTATGGALTTFCTDEFGGRGNVLTKKHDSVIVAPPIMDANYIWLCNAKLTAKDCEPNTPPAVPK
jgi:hypothetical protein